MISQNYSESVSFYKEKPRTRRGGDLQRSKLFFDTQIVKIVLYGRKNRVMVVEISQERMTESFFADFCSVGAIDLDFVYKQRRMSDFCKIPFRLNVL